MNEDLKVLKKASFVTSSKVRSKIMKLLQDREYATPKEISRTLGNHISTISKTLRELRNEGLVEFIEHEHSRSRLYFLTDDGKKVAGIVSKLSERRKDD